MNIFCLNVSVDAGRCHVHCNVRSRLKGRRESLQGRFHEESLRMPIDHQRTPVCRPERVTTIAADIDLAAAILDVADATAGVHLHDRSVLSIANDPGSFPRGNVIEIGAQTQWHLVRRPPRAPMDLRGALDR
jgi:hypothetical protein